MFHLYSSISTILLTHKLSTNHDKGSHYVNNELIIISNGEKVRLI